MKNRTPDQMDKVLALADSDQEGEALGALRMLRRLLARDNLAFSDLARVAQGLEPSPCFFSAAQIEMEARLEQLHEDLRAHVEQNESLTLQIDFWRQRVRELEKGLSSAQSEARRWRETARETAEKLWDMGQLAQVQEALSEAASEAASEAETEAEQDAAAPLPLQAAG